MNSEKIVKTVRKNLEKYVKEGQKIDSDNLELPEFFEEKKGVFVTLNKNGNLRGCIGVPYPRKTLKDALIDASSSVTTDPRFSNLKEEELDEVTVEVTVLTKPEKLSASSPEEVKEKIQIGEDGLIIEKGMRKGLLLPQVPVEQNWDSEEFLEGICQKAGLPPNEWKSEDVNLYKFQGKIFKEVSPNGEVVQREINSN